jgi:hypothetical protein
MQCGIPLAFFFWDMVGWRHGILYGCYVGLYFPLENYGRLRTGREMLM